MNVTTCNNPKCENFGEPCELTASCKRQIRDDAWGRPAWVDEFGCAITDCCGSDSFEEFSEKQWEEHIGFDEE